MADFDSDVGQKVQFKTRPDLSHSYDTGLDLPSELIAEIQRTGKRVFTKQVFDLSTAVYINASPIVISIPCYTVMALFYQTANATRKVVNGLVLCRAETNRPETEFTLKHSRQLPFGPLTKVYLGWAAQAGNSVELYFLHNKVPGMAINEFLPE